MIRRIILLLVIILFCIGTARATEYYITNAPSNMASTSYTYSVNLSNSTGTNNATHVYFNGHALPNFTDVRFTDSSNNNLSYWIEPYTGRAWVNRTSNTSIRLWYGNTSNVTTTGNPNATFLAWAGTNGSEFIQPVQNRITNVAFDAVAYVDNVNSNVWLGLATSQSDTPVDGQFVKQYSTNYYAITYNNSVTTTINTAAFLTTGSTYRYQFTRNSTAFQAAINDTLFMTPITTNLPDAAMGIGMNFQDANTAYQHFSFLRYYYAGVYLDTWSDENSVGSLPTSSTCDTTTDERAITQDESNQTVAGVTTIGQSFTTLEDMYNITAIYVYFPSTTSANELRLWTNDSKTEQLGNTVTNLAASGWVRYAFSSNVILSASTSYYFEFTPLGAETWQYNDSDPYAWGSLTVDGTNYPTYDLKFRIYTDDRNTTLISPSNSSITSVEYPPIIHDIVFSWSNSCVYNYDFQVAEDITFNLLEYDLSLSSATTTKAIDVGTHYWRVRVSNSSVTGNWSDIFSFTLTESTPSISGTAINGVVFEYIAGVQTPISGASVYLTNSTYTTQALTGSNGYFLFTGLNNASTYSLYSIKQGYDNSQVFYVTPANNSTTTVNLPMRIYISPYVPNFVFEKFIVRSLFDDPYPGVTVEIYVNGNINPSFTGTTDSMGQATFQLIKDTYYRIELSGGGLTSTVTAYFYAKEEEYLITITSGFPNTGDKYEDINASLYVTQINTTHANLSLRYVDNSSTTSIINFTARYYINNTDVCSLQTSTTNPITLNCTVFMGNYTYVFGWNATTTKYGIIQGAKVVDFKAQNASAQIPGIEDKMSSNMLQWVSILIIIFVAGMFSVRSVKFGAVIVPFVAVILYWVGTLQISALLVHSALILGILAYLRMNEHKVIT